MTEARAAGPPDPWAPGTTIGEALRAAAADSPDRAAIVEGTADPAMRRRWSYGSLLADAEDCAQALLRRFEPGDRIAIWAPNIAEYQLLQYGCALAGMTLVTVNPTFQAEEARQILARSRSVACFTVEEFRGKTPLATARGLREEIPTLREVIAFEEWDAFVGAAGAEVALPEVDSRCPALILYTSGTTGIPKGAMLPHVGMTTNVPNAAYRIAAGAGPESVWLATLPMFHLAGCVMATLGSLSLRGTLLIVRDFDPASCLRLIGEERVTTSNLVPTMMLAMLQHADYAGADLSSLRSIMLGGGPVAPALARRLEEELGIFTIVGYGMTEAASITMTSRDDDPDDRTATCGRPVPGVEVRIVEPESGRPCGLGKVGEAQTRGAHTMLGYDDPEATAQVFTADGWLKTGDLCSLDARGYLRMEGRVKDMIIRGGENIYPREIEDELLHDDAVAEVAVVGLPDAYYGEIVAAFVRLREGRAVTAATLSEQLRARLTGHKIPSRWYFVDDYPKTASGKIRKAELKDLWRQGNYAEAEAKAT